MDNSSWSAAEFGRAELGDVRRCKRLILIGAQIVAEPAGKMTEVFRSSSDLEGAGRFMRNSAVPPEELQRATNRATAVRCRGHAFVYAPTDQTSLTLTDSMGAKNLGAVGTTITRSRGLQVMSVIAVTPDGVPQGLLGQSYWARPEGPKKTVAQRRQLATEEKETQHWLDVTGQARTTLDEVAVGVRPWYQLDRGGDAWPLLVQALDEDVWFTVRACRDRRVIDEQLGDVSYLWSAVERTDVLGDYSLFVPGGPARRERMALIQLRACPVVLHLVDRKTHQEFAIHINAVLARELSTTPRGESPIEWMLLTSHPIDDLQEVHAVVFGYAQRWRIEDFHRAWKKGDCRIEESQLHERDTIVRWATLLAAVAMRTVRMSHLARHHAQLPATVEFTQPEIDALILARQPKNYLLGQVPTVAVAVRWVADEGGYTGKSSGGPPGAQVISRGLARIAVLARVLTRAHAPPDN